MVRISLSYIVIILFCSNVTPLIAISSPKKKATPLYTATSFPGTPKAIDDLIREDIEWLESAAHAKQEPVLTDKEKCGYVIAAGLHTLEISKLPVEKLPELQKKLEQLATLVEETQPPEQVSAYCTALRRAVAERIKQDSNLKKPKALFLVFFCGCSA